ncbi:MAG: BrnT family toxin [Verrucomicrobiales bacterium]|nr:BrnT family toxin [Verrucomicrobiales bacterium]
MEFDWLNCPFDLKKTPPREVAEAFEDPFSIRLLPEFDEEGETRYFILGRTVENRYLFAIFWTDGKNYRVIACRDCTDDERSFYERKNAEWLN